MAQAGFVMSLLCQGRVMDNLTLGGEICPLSPTQFDVFCCCHYTLLLRLCLPHRGGIHRDK